MASNGSLRKASAATGLRSKHQRNASRASASPSGSNSILRDLKGSRVAGKLQSRKLPAFGQRPTLCGAGSPPRAIPRRSSTHRLSQTHREGPLPNRSAPRPEGQGPRPEGGPCERSQMAARHRSFRGGTGRWITGQSTRPHDGYHLGAPAFAGHFSDRRPRLTVLVSRNRQRKRSPDRFDPPNSDIWPEDHRRE